MPRTFAYVRSFHLDHSGINRIAVSKRTEAAVRDLARKAMVMAVTTAPQERGNYRRSFRVNVHVRNDWPHGTAYPVPRVCADLVNVDPAAFWIEKGFRYRARGGEVKAVAGHYTMTNALLRLASAGRGSARRPRASRGVQ